MQLPKDFDKTAAADGGAVQLPVGGYVCLIKRAEAVKARNGSEMLRILYDIDEGEYREYYLLRYNKDKQYQSAHGGEIAWRGRYDTFVLTRDGKTNPFFKGLLTAIEDSNPGVTLIENGQLNEDRLKNCHVGLVMGEEEFKGQDGTVRTTVRPRVAVSVAKIREGAYTIPPIRRLPNQAPSQLAGFVAVSDDDGELPF